MVEHAAPNQQSVAHRATGHACIDVPAAPR